MPYPEGNALANALSPYLRQHAGNPVHWRAWGPEAFAEAQERNCPVLLSVGYAACHWCHVMAHESFEDPETADLMNRWFVNIKVDREERPDIDQIYMTALHAMGDQGGWPLTMFLTPAKEAFWGGTYFPPDGRYGRPGFRDVLKAIHRLYHDDQGKVAGNASAISRHLRQTLASTSNPTQPTPSDIDTVADRLAAAVDPLNGGLGGAPKFPSAPMFESLARLWVRHRAPAIRDACDAWMSALCRGGIYDHLGGGIHRYTVDGRWLIPHFEKMLYDNAQFIRSLAFTHALTGSELFRRRIEASCDFLLRDMRAPGGGFVSSFDADSEGEEGRYYVWTRAEIDRILEDAAPAFCAAYDVTPEGNWEGRSILNRLHASAETELADETAFADARAILMEHRRKRAMPGCDDKILADWNGLAIRALSEAGRQFARPDWQQSAIAAFDFVTESITFDGRLGHAYRQGVTSGPALAGDLASMMNAAISLFAATANGRFLDRAADWAQELEKRYADGEGGYFVAAEGQADLPFRARSDQDEAIPSASATVIEALVRMSLATDETRYAERAERALSAAWGRVKDNPFASVGIANAADTALRSPKLVMTGPAESLSATARRFPDPARLDLLLDEPDLIRTYAANLPLNGESPQAFLCRGLSCMPPVTDPADLERLLADPSS